MANGLPPATMLADTLRPALSHYRLTGQHELALIHGTDDPLLGALALAALGILLYRWHHYKRNPLHATQD